MNQSSSLSSDVSVSIDSTLKLLHLKKHMSVHGNPAFIQQHYEAMQYFLQPRKRSSNISFGVGFVAIQLIVISLSQTIQP